MSVETTFVLIKPDAVEAFIVGHILREFEDLAEAKFTLIQMSPGPIPESFWRVFYANLKDRPEIYDRQCEFMASGPVVAVGITGEDVIERVREKVGATDPFKARYGTIRAKFGNELPRNAVHASDSEESAIKEASLWFGKMMAPY